MSIYINPQGEYPRHIGDIQLEFPEYKQGDDLPTDWIQVQESELPEVGVNQVVYETYPVKTNGVWYQTFEVRDLTAEELEARKVAEIRRKVADGEMITSDEAALLVG